MSAKLKFENATVRSRFKLIAEIDEESITTGFADSGSPRVLPDDDEAGSTHQVDKGKKKTKLVVA